jgi:hypothetical protein
MDGTRQRLLSVQVAPILGREKLEGAAGEEVTHDRDGMSGLTG